MADFSFVLTDPETGLEVQITITEIGDVNDDGNADLQFDVAIISDGIDADLRGLFFDVSDASLIPGLTATGVSDQDYGDDSISNLGQGVNVNGEVVDEFGKFDAGVAFGEPGAGDGRLTSASFVLSSSLGDLTLDMFSLQDFAIRTTSDGAKFGGTAPEIETTPPPDVEATEFDIDENAYEGAVVGQVVDVNQGNGTVFSIVGGDPDGAFAIDAATGEITVARRDLLDYETTQVFALQVEATNAAGSDVATVTVSLNDRVTHTVTGTSGADNISLNWYFLGGELQEGVMRVTVNGVQTLVDNAELFAVEGLDGNDFFNISGNFDRGFLAETGFDVRGGGRQRQGLLQR